MARILGGDEVRIKANGAITATAAPVGTARVQGNAIILESANAGIGTRSAPIAVSQIGSDPGLTARAAGHIFIDSYAQNLAIASIFTPGTVRITNGNDSILAANDNGDPVIAAVVGFDRVREPSAVPAIAVLQQIRHDDSATVLAQQFEVAEQRPRRGGTMQNLAGLLD